ncbi:hypothetical protein Fuma_01878 [Fuerstiella marisgermanici]|uniref:Uncharacterized protein n=1 Tax=Fuerstiella marisgermanici TaxID=1891926 RepID=A0A1P8WDW6_9PLAN|nr:hypothetical protein Fuma_01878 [Fuerstiella marisgermanici]
MARHKKFVGIQLRIAALRSAQRARSLLFRCQHIASRDRFLRHGFRGVICERLATHECLTKFRGAGQTPTQPIRPKCRKKVSAD